MTLVFCHVIILLIIPTLQLELQARLQKREQLVAKKSELTAQIETLDREIKVCHMTTHTGHIF